MPFNTYDEMQISVSAKCAWSEGHLFPMLIVLFHLDLCEWPWWSSFLHSGPKKETKGNWDIAGAEPWVNVEIQLFTWSLLEQSRPH